MDVDRARAQRAKDWQDNGFSPGPERGDGFFTERGSAPKSALKPAPAQEAAQMPQQPVEPVPAHGFHMGKLALSLSIIAVPTGLFGWWGAAVGVVVFLALLPRLIIWTQRSRKRN